MSFEIKSYFCIKIVGAYTALKGVTYTREKEREKQSFNLCLAARQRTQTQFIESCKTISFIVSYTVLIREKTYYNFFEIKNEF